MDNGVESLQTFDYYLLPYKLTGWRSHSSTILTTM